MAKSLKTYSSVLWVFKILKVKSRYLQELIKSFSVGFFFYYFHPSLMKFCLIFHRNYLIKNKSSLQILLIIQFVSCTMGKCFEGILAFLTLMVGESRCGKRVTDGVGEVLTGMIGSNMRHLVKVLLQLENLASN